jgi:hypothetical protein
MAVNYRGMRTNQLSVFATRANVIKHFFLSVTFKFSSKLEGLLEYSGIACQGPTLKLFHNKNY